MEPFYNWLRSVCSPGWSNAIEESFDLLGKVHGHQVNVLAMDILHQTDTTDTVTLLDQLNGLVVEMLVVSLVRYGVFLNEDLTYISSIPTLNKVLETLEELSDCEYAEIEHILNNENITREERLAELVGTFTDTDTESVLPYIDEVKPAFVENLKRIYVKDVPSMDFPEEDAGGTVATFEGPVVEQPEVDEDVIELANRISDGPVKDYVIEGLPLGDLENSEDLQNEIATLSNLSVAAEQWLLLAYAAGNKEPNEIKEVLSHYFDLYYDDDLKTLLGLGRALKVAISKLL